MEKTMNEAYARFFEALNDIISDPNTATWQDRRDALVKAAGNDRDLVNLNELLSWFDGELV